MHRSIMDRVTVPQEWDTLTLDERIYLYGATLKVAGKPLYQFMVTNFEDVWIEEYETEKDFDGKLAENDIYSSTFQDKENLFHVIEKLLHEAACGKNQETGFSLFENRGHELKMCLDRDNFKWQFTPQLVESNSKKAQILSLINQQKHAVIITYQRITKELGEEVKRKNRIIKILVEYIFDSQSYTLQIDSTDDEGGDKFINNKIMNKLIPQGSNLRKSLEGFGVPDFATQFLKYLSDLDMNDIMRKSVSDREIWRLGQMMLEKPLESKPVGKPAKRLTSTQSMFQTNDAEEEFVPSKRRKIDSAEDKLFENISISMLKHILGDENYDGKMYSKPDPKEQKSQPARKSGGRKFGTVGKKRKISPAKAPKGEGSSD